MDTLEIRDAQLCYRGIIDTHNHLLFVPIPQKEALLKPCKIVGKKTLRKGKVQLNLNDGRNIMVEKDTYSTGDTLLLELPGQKIHDHFTLEKGAYVYLDGGKHTGRTGIVEKIDGNVLYFKPEGENTLIETKKAFAIVLGKGTSAITLDSTPKTLKK
ncbi:hypothetical protein COY95_02775 [Candidatus Woesearchaeota archaeon CG_4_10_14_0_8_um_filter_47_5]|nr:MAG: hypothetical protein COY95_02775 [Candidatus Woesearchaeota archaeon CG_4_10_14_0_8_um_filter_47_5]